MTGNTRAPFTGSDWKRWEKQVRLLSDYILPNISGFSDLLASYFSYSFSFTLTHTHKLFHMKDSFRMQEVPETRHISHCFFPYQYLPEFLESRRDRNMLWCNARDRDLLWLCYESRHNMSECAESRVEAGAGVERRGGWIKQCHRNPQCCESSIPFSFIKPISRRGELREEALNLSAGNNGALKGWGESKLGTTSQTAN